MFKRILIANRGEIASRIISTCRDLNIETVAVFSTEDRALNYVNRADYAIHIGDGPVYKDYDLVLKTAKKMKVDAIHPGYGFLAEDEVFAAMCEKEKITFIGASSSFLKSVNDKSKVKNLCQKLKINTLKSKVVDSSLKIEDFKKEIKDLSYPIVLKPNFGSYAKGVRRLEKEKDISDAFGISVLEEKISIGKGKILIEQALPASRHIEVPILRDKKGNILSFPELNCSMQRRYLKIMAETPVPYISDKVKEYIIKSSKLLANELKMEGLSTFEFLVKDDNAYFMEINPRLTVEHPITEKVTGFDLVREQINISSGKDICMDCKDIRPRGCAVMVRIFSEDPATFIPYSGVIKDILLPLEPNARHEVVAQTNWRIPIHYDHMLAKMSVNGKERSELIRRMTRLLIDYYFAGVVTNIQLQRQIFETKEVLEGSYDIDFLREKFIFKAKSPSGDFEKAVKLGAGIKIYKEEKEGYCNTIKQEKKLSSWQKTLGKERL
jgi:acetyl-CoA carboxylase, biotin carboxylase subunit